MKETKDNFLTPNPFLQKVLNKIEGSYINELPVLSKDKFFHLAVGGKDTYDFRSGIHKFLHKYPDEMRENIEVKYYPEAGHIIDVPYTPSTERTFLLFWKDKNKFPGEEHHPAEVIFGGEPLKTADMQAEVWQNLLKSIERHIRDESLHYQSMFR